MREPGISRRRGWPSRCGKALIAAFDTPWRWLLRVFGARPRVLFNIALEGHLAILEPIFRPLCEDPRIDVRFTFSPSCGTPDTVTLSHSGVDPSTVLSPRHVRLTRCDVCVEADYASPRLWRPARWVQTFHGAADKFTPMGANFTLHDMLGKYDRLFCMSQRHVEMLRRSSLLRGKDAARCIGYPKLDALVHADRLRAEVLREYGADPARRSVLYAPSWNPQLSLHRIGERLIEQLCGQDWTLLVKLHPISYREHPPFAGSHAWGMGQDWRAMLNRSAQRGRLIVVPDGEACRHLAAADMLITDFGSTLFEYMILDRPILYYHTLDTAAIMAIPEDLPQILRAVTPFASTEKALAWIERGGQPQAPEMSAARRALASERFYGVGGAGVRAVCALYDLLAMDPPGEAKRA